MRKYFLVLFTALLALTSLTAQTKTDTYCVVVEKADMKSEEITQTIQETAQKISSQPVSKSMSGVLWTNLTEDEAAKAVASLRDNRIRAEVRRVADDATTFTVWMQVLVNGKALSQTEYECTYISSLIENAYSGYDSFGWSMIDEGTGCLKFEFTPYDGQNIANGQQLLCMLESWAGNQASDVFTPAIANPGQYIIDAANITLDGATFPFTYRPGEYGSPTNPVTLNFVPATSVVGKPFSVNIGDQLPSYLLESDITYTPANATKFFNWNGDGYWLEYGYYDRIFQYNYETTTTTFIANMATPEGGLDMDFGNGKQGAGGSNKNMQTVNVTVNDPDNATYYLSVYANGQSLSFEDWNSMYSSTVMPYCEGNPIYDEPIPLWTIYTRSEQNINIYPVVIPKEYAGKKIDFVVNFSRDQQYDSNNLPYEGAYLIRNVYQGRKTLDQMPVAGGAVYGSFDDPVILNYVPLSRLSLKTSYQVNVDATFSPEDLLNITPTNASIPYPLDWRMDSNPFIEYDWKAGAFKALAATSSTGQSVEVWVDDAYQPCPVVVNDPNGCNYFALVTFHGKELEIQGGMPSEYNFIDVTPFIDGVAVGKAVTLSRVQDADGTYRGIYPIRIDAQRYSRKTIEFHVTTHYDNPDIIGGEDKEIESNTLPAFGEFIIRDVLCDNYTTAAQIPVTKGKVWGTVNNPVKLNFILSKEVTTTPEALNLTVGEQFDLSTVKYNFLPENSSIPVKFQPQWGVGNYTKYMQIDHGTTQTSAILKALAPTSEGETIAVEGHSDDYYVAIPVTIKEKNIPVTGISIIKGKENQVLWVGSEYNSDYFDWRESYLTLDDLYTIQPENATRQEVKIESIDHPEIVEYGGSSNEFGDMYVIAQKVGNAVITLATEDGGFTAKVNVEVRSHVQSLRLSEQSLTVKKGSTTGLIQYLTVLPDNAYQKNVTWAVTDTATVVSVSKNAANEWVMKANRSGSTTLQVTSADNPQATAYLTINVTSPATGITVTKPNQEVWIGENIDLSYSILPAGSTSKVAKWESSNPNVVEITGGQTTAAYTATAKGAGTATLTVTTDNGMTATISVTVKAHVTGIRLSQQALTFENGSTVALDPYVTVLPDNAANKKVSWKSGDESVVIVIQNDANQWFMTTVGCGSTTLTVTSEDNKQAMARLTVTVKEKTIDVTGISIIKGKESQVLYVDDYLELSNLYEIQPTNATRQEVKWESKNPEIINYEGQSNEYGGDYAQAKAVGKTTLTVTTEDGGYTAQVSVEVRAHVTAIRLTQNTFNMQVGVPFDLSKYVKVVPENAYNTKVRWESINQGDFTINGNTVTPTKAGQFTLRVIAEDDYNKAASECTVIVTSPATGITVTQPNQTVWIGENIDLSYSILPAGSTSTIKSWTSSNEAVVAISGGQTTAYTATAKSAGTATLTVETDNGMKATITVTVKAHVTGLRLSQQTLTVNNGSTTGLDQYVTVLPDNANDKSVTWQSDNQKVVTVSQNAAKQWQMTAVGSGTATLTVTSTDNAKATATLTVTVESRVTGITTTEETQVLWIGETLPLTEKLYTITPSDAANKNVTWTSNNTSVATVERGQNGFVVKGVAVGKTTLTVTSAENNKITGTLNIEVRAHVSGITLKQQALTLQRGGTQDLSTLVTVSPSNAFDASVTWSSDNTSIVAINGNTATAKAIGTATLTATSVDNPKATATLTVTVNADASAISVAKPSQTVWIGENVDLTTSFTPADATSTIKSWKSSNEAVVAISGGQTTSAYTATAKSVGTATLTVTTDNGKTATIEVTVKAHVTDITLSQQTLTVNNGSTTGLDQYVTVLPDNANDKSVTWQSDNQKVVTVSQNAAKQWQMTAVGSGTATLTVTSTDNAKATATLTVTVESRVTGITTTEETQVLWIGETLPLTEKLYTITPSDAANKNVTWTSNNTSVATVERGQNGFVVKGVAVGKTTLTVTSAENNKITGTLNIEVRAHVSGITLKQQALTLQRGGTQDLSTLVTVSPSNAFDASVTWSSDNTSIVAINGNTATAKAIGTATLTATSVDNPKAIATLAVTVNADASAISVAKPSQTVWIGENVDLTTSFTPADATSTIKSWKSSNEAVVAISGTAPRFTATAKSVGTATLTVTTDNGKTATIEVTVNTHVTEIKLSKQAITLQRGGTEDLSKLITVLPVNAVNKEVTWKSGDDKIVSVTGSSAIANAIGTTTLTVTSNDNPQATASLTITVEAAAAGVYAVNPVQELWIGDKADLSIYFEPKDATSKVKSWKSDNEAVVAISGGQTTAYTATAKGAGKATLTVETDNGMKATISVTVKAHVTGLRLSQQALTVDNGSTTGLDQYVTVLPDNAFDKSVTWKSGNEKVVTVSQDANKQWQMKAIASGTATLTVTSVDNAKATATITVTVESRVTGITTVSETQVLWIGETLPLTEKLYTITPEDALNKSVTWTCNNTQIVTIEQQAGQNMPVAKAQGAGTTTLTITTAEGGFKGTIHIEVRAHVTGLTLSQQALTLQRGGTTDLAKLVTVLPADAYDKSVTWKSSDEKIVSISGSTATAKGIGTTTLTVTSNDNPQATATLTVTVEAAAAGIFAVNPVQELWIGDKADLSIRFEPADATSKVKSWKSDNEAVVAISGSGSSFTATAKSAGTATLTVETDNGMKATISVTVKAHVTGITLSQQALTVNNGSTTGLDQYVTILPANAFDKSVTWKSDNSNIVTISQDANKQWQMKAVASGTTMLTVTSNDNAKATATLTVNVESRVTGITTTEETQVLWIGETLPLTEKLYTLTPSDAANKNVTWTSNNTKIVTIEQEAGQNAPVAKAQGAGTTTLTVTTAEGGYKGIITIEVRAHVSSLSLSQQALTLQRGATQDLAKLITVLPANAYDKSVVWKSNDEKIVSVSGSSTATAKGIGTTTLTVTSNDNPQATARLTVTVEAAAAGIYAVNPVQELWIGDKADLSIRFEPADATSKVKSWTSNNPDVIAISGSGSSFTATAKSAGTATLTVETDNGMKATIEVTVKAHVTSLSLSQQALTLQRGGTQDLSKLVTILPANAYDKSVTWKSSDEKIVSVSGSTATAKGIGTTTLTVTSNDNPQATARLTITVEAAAAGVYAVNPVQELWIGEQADLEIFFEPKDATSKVKNWTSSNPEVIAVSGSGSSFTATAKSVGTATLTVETDNGMKANIEVTVKAHVTSLTLSQQTLTLQRGAAEDLSKLVTVLPANAADKSVTWKSSDEKIVSVSGNTATAKGIGTTTLTVTSNDNPQATARLTITVEAAAAGVYAVNPEQTLAVGDEVDLSIRFEPEDATSKVKSWESTNPSVIVISRTATGFTAVAKAAGTSTLTVTTDNDQTATIEVTVYNVLEEIRLSVSEATLEKGETLQLRSLITTIPADAIYDLSIEYRPKEGAEEYLSVDKEGKVTAIASTSGDSYEVEIIVTDGFGHTASTTISICVTVTPTAIRFDAPSQSVPVNGEVKLGYSIQPEDADLPGTEEWTSSNKEVVRIERTDEGWKAYAVGVGQATVTLTVGKLSSSIDVEVYSTLEYIELNTQGEQMKVGETLCLDDFIAGFYPKDAADTRVIWKAEDEKIASVAERDGKWYVTGLAEGWTSLMVQSVANPDIASYMSLGVLTGIFSITAVTPEQYVFTDTYADLSVEILPVEAAGRYVEWTCNDMEAVRFESDPYTGKIMAQFNKYGDFTLTGTPDEGEHTCTILVHVVKHVESLALNIAERITLDAGQSRSLDELLVFTPEDAYNKEVIWTTGNSEVATVTFNDGHWTVNGIGSGLTTLHVVAADNPEATADIEVSVTQRVTGITVEEPEQEVYTGECINLTYTILPASADNQNVTWESSNPEVIDFELAEDELMAQAQKAGTATLTFTTEDGGYTASIKVTVRQAITDIQLKSDTLRLDLNENVDLNSYIQAILPDDAYNKEVVWSGGAGIEEYLKINADGHTATTLKETTSPLSIYVGAKYGYAGRTAYVEIYNRPKQIVVNSPEQTVSVGDILDLGFTVLPEGSRYNPEDIVWTSSNERIVYLGHDCFMTHWTEEINAKAMMSGKATLTVSLPKEDIHATIEVTVTAPEPTAIWGDLLDILKGETGRAIVRTEPYGAFADPSKLEVTLHYFTGIKEEDKLQPTDSEWIPCRWETGVDDEGNTYIEVEALSLGQYTLDLTYPGTEGSTLDLYFGQGIDLYEGWNWVTMLSSRALIDGLARIDEAFQGKLKDARTSSELLYLDPVDGLFGDLTRFYQNSYKMEVTEDMLLANRCIDYDIHPNCSTTVFKDWNWMMYPYDTDFTMAELTAKGAFAGALSGDRIVRKDGGFAEYDGTKWTGTLTELCANEGYMYYSMDDHNLDMPSPKALGQKLGEPDKAPSRRTLVDGNSVWQYNHRRFADNMTIIATLSGVTFPDDCTIGAFVDGECRGEGRYADGRFFITVHGKAGEQVTFLVYDEATDTYYTVPGILGFDTMAGSLQHPVGLKVGDKTTDIAIIPSSEVDGVLYDLAGRRVVSPAPGYYIRNGKMILVK